MSLRYRGRQGFQLGPIGFLIVINLILLIVTSIRPQFIFVLGLNPASFLERPWTIITSMFVHSGFGHIFANMLTLYFFGSYLLSLIGERKFFIIYFGGGILGGVLYILLAPPFSIAVGASGAVFAVGGALTVLRPKLTVFVFPIPVPLPLWMVVIGGFLIMSFSPLIAWQAHLGGLAFGLAAGYLFKKSRRFY
ncbi:MAG: rhomboid family intramembrane serine protease [Dehalococcoidales bacterium]|nr:rhomboid family intramembrane serine protease [Dehalococcoidales bacterium]